MPISLNAIIATVLRTFSDPYKAVDQLIAYTLDKIALEKKFVLIILFICSFKRFNFNFLKLHLCFRTVQ
jgi:hypothetical protein